MLHASIESASPEFPAGGREDGADAALREPREIDPPPDLMTDAPERPARICAAYWAY
jgi:hypothetical protein